MIFIFLAPKILKIQFILRVYLKLLALFDVDTGGLVIRGCWLGVGGLVGVVVYLGAASAVSAGAEQESGGVGGVHVPPGQKGVAENILLLVVGVTGDVEFLGELCVGEGVDSNPRPHLFGINSYVEYELCIKMYNNVMYK